MKYEIRLRFFRGVLACAEAGRIEVTGRSDPNWRAKGLELILGNQAGRSDESAGVGNLARERKFREMFWTEIRRRHEETGKFAGVVVDSVRAPGGVQPCTTTGEDNGERYRLPSRRKHSLGNSSDFVASVYDGGC